MSSPLFTASQFCSYWLKAVGPHSLHSPFLFDLYNEVIKKSKRSVQGIEAKRKELIASDEQIDVIDFKTGKVRRSIVGHVARTSLSSSKFSNFLRLLCEYLEVKTVLETGTSLGINAMYLSAAKSVKKVVTIEGSDIIARIAEKTLADVRLVKIVSGNVHDHFVKELVQNQPELIFIDADHRGSVILETMDVILKHCPAVKCIVFHDIYWSPDMKQAWDVMVANPSYPLTLDIFQAGLIFPNQPIVKQHFALRF